MPSSILSVQPRRRDLVTATTDDWTDAFPLYEAGAAGVVIGSGNKGNGALTVASIDPLTLLGGHRITVTDVGGLTAITATDPSGAVTAQGYAGAPLAAGGIAFTLAVGSVPFQVGDVFAVQPTVSYIDDSDFVYVLQVRPSQTSPVVTFEARSSPADGSTPTIVAGGGTGVPAMIVPYNLMSAERFPAGSYVYELIAISEDRRKVCYYGNLDHEYGVALLG